MTNQTYHQLTQSEPPTPFLLKTLDIPGISAGRALELGCGSGNDAVELLKRGWEVTAIDSVTEGLEFLKEKAKNYKNADIQNVYFESMELKENFYDLIYSRYSLSFCQKKDWAKVWKVVLNSLKKGGHLSIHLFGVNDDFKDSKRHGKMTLFSNTEVDELLKDFDVLFRHEDEHDAKSKVGQMKHWHVFTIVAKKK